MSKYHTKLITSSTIAALASIFLTQGAIHADQVTVKSGDTLSAISRKYNTTVNDLVKNSNISNPNFIKPGEIINTDTSSLVQSNTNNANVITVTVKEGDTLSSIAEKYNTSVSKIKQDNGLTSDLIYVGEQLKVTPGDTDTQNSTNTAQNSSYNQSNANSTNGSNTQVSAQTSTNNYQGVSTYQPIAINQGSQASYSSSVAGNDAAAKAWIASRESGGNYNARNGQYIGKYQLSAAYLGGDYSPANQERVADQYVAGRYGSWANAQRFWQANGWY